MIFPHDTEFATGRARSAGRDWSFIFEIRREAYRQPNWVFWKIKRRKREKKRRKGRRQPPMDAYRFYLLDCRNSIAAVEVIYCGSDIEARQSADTLLVQRPEFHGDEVWQMERRVYVNVVGVDAAE
jgi:hypothetical protein